MPPDFSTVDRHRMPFHHELFTQPLNAFDVAHAYTDASVADQVSRAMKDLNLGDVVPGSFLLVQRLSEKLKISSEDMEKIPNYAGFILASLVEAEQRLSDTRSQWQSRPEQFSLCDSLWMNEQDDDTGMSLFESYEKAREARRRAEVFFDGANPEEFGPVLNAGLDIYGLALEVKDILDPRVGATSVIIINTSIGRVALGTMGDDVYVGDFVLIIDPGGNDTYRPGNRTKEELLKQPHHIIIDGGGDDVYIGGDFAFGAGFTGVGIVVDAGGNDTYSAGNFSLGCGLFGIGILHDEAGQDTYLGKQNCQGAGFFGIGILKDVAGHDTYRCHAQAQGFGATRGYGMLADDAGNDQYIASSPFVDALRYEAHFVTFTQGASLGFRPIASGGIGLLADGGGNDNYITDIYGQGTAYWFGLGAIVDYSGEDRYQAYQYAQGSGVHFATGIVHDLKGDDVYVSHGVSQGCGHDVALGALIDEHGNDSYVVESLSLGGGNANAISIFVDRAGDDSYIARNTSNTLGYSDFRRYSGMIGLFIDGGGDDRYSENSRNDSTSIQSTFGAFVDAEIVKDSVPSQSPVTYAHMVLEDDIDKLFIQASAAPLKYQNNVTPAREKIAGLGIDVLPYLLPYLGTQMPRERLALEDILPKLRKVDSSVIDKLIIDSLESLSGATKALMGTLAGKSQATTVIPAFIEMSKDTSWKSRRLAALALGRIGDSSAVDALTTMLTDDHPYVRARAAYAIGIIGTQDALDRLKITFSDGEAIVRYTSVEGARRGKKRSFDEVATYLDGAEDYTNQLVVVRLLPAVDTSTANRTKFVDWYNEADDDLRVVVNMTWLSLPESWQDYFERPKAIGSLK